MMNENPRQLEVIAERKEMLTVWRYRSNVFERLQSFLFRTVTRRRGLFQCNCLTEYSDLPSRVRGAARLSNSDLRSKECQVTT
jgi:hypothetical protein